jgi:hypothetical protein
VDAITLKALLNAEGLRRGVPPAPRFCATAGCPTVYFDNAVQVRFDERLLAVRVGAKHPEDPDALVCYCFDLTAAAIRRRLETARGDAASADVARELKAGRCACEVKNPKGACCLGDVTRTERAALEAAAAA